MQMMDELYRVALRVAIPADLQVWFNSNDQPLKGEALAQWLIDDLEESEFLQVVTLLRSSSNSIAVSMMSFLIYPDVAPLYSVPMITTNPEKPYASSTFTHVNLIRDC